MSLADLEPLREDIVDDAVVRIVKRKLAEGEKLRLRVISASMLPLLRVGDQVSIAALNAKESISIPPGAVVVFRIDNRFHVHRFLGDSKRNRNEIITKGDNVPLLDPPVPRTAVIGRVDSIERNKVWARPYLPFSVRLRTIRRKFFDAAIHVVLAASKFHLFRLVFKAAYHASISIATGAFRNSVAGSSLYLKGSAAIREIEPAISDLDLLIVLPPCSPQAFRDHSLALQQRAKNLGRIMPHLGGLFVFSHELFSFWNIWGGIRVGALNEWQLLFGAEVRKTQFIQQSTALKISCLREFHQSYSFAYRSLKQLAIAPKLEAWIRMLRHLLDLIKYSTLVGQSEINLTSCSASRAQFVENMLSGPLKECAGALQRQLALRCVPSLELILQTFSAATISALSEVCSDKQISHFDTLSSAIPDGSLLKLFRSELRYSILSDSHWTTELNEFFLKSEWAWRPAPLPAMLIRVLNLLHPFHSNFLHTHSEPEHDILLNMELAEMGAIFSSSFRPAFAKAFCLSGLYFAALNCALKTGKRASTIEELEAQLLETEEKSASEVRQSIKFLKQANGFLSPAQFRKFGVSFSQLLEDCLQLRT